MPKFLRSLLATAAAFVAFGSANAAVVTFEGLAIGGGCTPGAVSSEGLDFSTTFYQCTANTGGTGGAVSNGTNFLYHGFGTQTVTATNGNPFDLLGLDLGASWYNANSVDHVTLTAFFHGGGSAAQVLSITQPDFTTHVLSLTNLDSFTISPASDGDTCQCSPSYPGYVAVDNIIYRQTQVPEPGSLALLGLALAGVGFRRRVMAA